MRLFGRPRRWLDLEGIIESCGEVGFSKYQSVYGITYLYFIPDDPTL